MRKGYEGGRGERRRWDGVNWAAKASTGKDSVGNDTSVEVKKETDQNKDKSKTDADGDVEMKDATEPEDVRAKKKTERRPIRRKGLQMKVQKSSDTPSKLRGCHCQARAPGSEERKRGGGCGS